VHRTAAFEKMTILQFGFPTIDYADMLTSVGEADVSGDFL
jgi:hypothetical protein